MPAVCVAERNVVEESHDSVQSHKKPTWVNNRPIRLETISRYSLFALVLIQPSTAS